MDKRLLVSPVAWFADCDNKAVVVDLVACAVTKTISTPSRKH